MQYRKDKYGNDLSVLGLGCMRFPKKYGSIDQDEVNRQVKLAFDSGINYFDTAYIYPGVEEALGIALEVNGIRDRVNIATKLPHYMIKKPADIDRYFREQLKRLRTDHVDYYLMHMLPDVASWEFLKKMGMEEWLAARQAEGSIRQVGFSYHGNTIEFQKLLAVRSWDFCQIQYNYVDEFTQAGRAGIEKAHSMGIPVVIMEPLRGGRLVNALPKKARDAFSAADPGKSSAEWGLQWLWNQDSVTVVLSGMNSPEMFADNCRAADRCFPGSLSVSDLQVYEAAKTAITATVKVGCTGCSYCMPCPQGVDIPGTFRCYNSRYNEGWYTSLKEYFMTTTLRRTTARASQCVKCGRCEKHCPQHIEIRKELENAAKALETPAFKLVCLGAKLLKRN